SSSTYPTAHVPRRPKREAHPVQSVPHGGSTLSNLADVQASLPTLAMVVTPPSQENLRLAAQIGVRQIVGRYPGAGEDGLITLRDRVREAGLELGVIEGYLPLQRIVNGSAGRDDDIAEIIALIETMGRLG